MRVEVGVATDIGQVREGNEDAFLVEPPLYAVADGMGGHRGGEVASQLALETVEQLFHAGDGTLAEQVREANRVVFERSSEDRKVTGMGTTLTAAVIEGNLARVAHVGDSRAYLLRADALRQLTEDHTLVGRMMKAGEISSAEAEVHPHRNVLTRALGTEPDVAVDEEEVGLLDGDRLLLCSDGLTNMVTEDQIQAILEAASAPQQAADRLVRAANRAGGVDNITVVVLDLLDDEGWPVEPGSARREASVDAVPEHEPGSARSPLPMPTRRSLFRAGLAVALAVVVLAAGLVALRVWLDGRWYVGVANERVAIYQGIPASILGFELSHVELQTEIPAADAQALPLYANLSEGLNQNSREEAELLMQQIREDLRQQRRADRERDG